jgi:hypothetical protein
VIVAYITPSNQTLIPMTAIYKTLTYAAGLVFLVVALAACDSTEPDDDEGAGEEELITRVVLTLDDGGETVTATADDPDGDGVDIQVETLTLTPGTVYDGTIEVYNDLADEPVEQDITAEIEEEDDEHQFFYTVDGFGDNVRVDITDFDDSNLPVGLAFQVNVTDAASGSGTLNVVLSHYDDEPKNGVDRSDETDIDVTFPVEIAP